MTSRPARLPCGLLLRHMQSHASPVLLRSSDNDKTLQLLSSVLYHFYVTFYVTFCLNRELHHGLIHHISHYQSFPHTNCWFHNPTCFTSNQLFV